MTEIVHQAGVTRFEVINRCTDPDKVFLSAFSGRMLVSSGVHVDLCYQDEGRTLKVFLSDSDGE